VSADWEDQVGACYLAVVRPESRARVLLQLGLWPSVRRVLQLSSEHVLPLEYWEYFRLTFGPRGAHVIDDPWGLQEGSVLVCDYLYSCAREVGRPENGCLAATLLYEVLVKPRKIECALDMPVGGVEPRLPEESLCTSAVYESYNWAVVAYYGLNRGAILDRHGVGKMARWAQALGQRECEEVRTVVSAVKDEACVSAVGAQCSAGANESRESDLPAGGGCAGVSLGVDGSGSLGVPVAGQCTAGVVDPPGRGKNYARNLANRQAQKERKKKRKMLGVDWRDRRACGDVQTSGGPVRSRGSGDRASAGGLWNSCPEDVRQGLVDSKARWHIAANRRKAAEEEEKLKRLESPTAVLVQEMIRVTGMANKLKSQTANAAIGGWAEVVADSLTRSVAESAASSVPSLESIGYGQSALRSSGGDTTASRCADYDRAMQAVKARFEHYDSYCEEDYDFAVKVVKDEFADVAYTPEERLKQEKATAVVAALSSNGMGYQTIEDTLERLQLV